MPDSPRTPGPPRATGTRTLRHDSFTVSVRTWPHPDAGPMAGLTFAGAHDEDDSLPPDTVVAHWLEDIRAMGYASVRTGAVGPGISRRLGAFGFACVQDLSLLSADLTNGLVAGGRARRIRVLTRQRLDGVLEVDRRSFPGGWHMDAAMLRDARHATARSALWVPREGGHRVGFVLAGRTAATGYVQRLAVDPSRRRHGSATALLAAAHSWMRASGCSVSMVNTEPTNEPALGLYRRFGYVALPYRLQVLECDLTKPVTA
ncbi:MAG: GNAT family N-acetyltransferase [Acidimicrobiales bacterium]